ncbi:MAG: class I SAM-dependent methyltransferase [Solirubrobacterales bacterium]
MSAPVRRLALRPPPGTEAVPDFDGGWLRPDGSRDAYLRYAGDGRAVNWSVELEELHAENSRDHYIDAWTREAILERRGPLPAGATIADLGCSTGYLLEDLRSAQPDAQLVGVDLVESGLRTAHHSVPDASLLQADVCALPLADSSVDAVVSANLLEHVSADVSALVELHRVLRPGARAVLVVPVGPGVYDYYDRFLGHERRYARGELTVKARRAGFEILEDIHLGSILFPAFWVVKKRNRRCYGHLQGAALASRVAADIAATRDSRVGRLACEIERLMLRAGIRLPFGIRGLTVVRRPEVEE